MKLHDLTEKEIQKLDEAASTVKKFAKYIKGVNLSNYWLQKNLDESIRRATSRMRRSAMQQKPIAKGGKS